LNNAEEGNPPTWEACRVCFWYFQLNSTCIRSIYDNGKFIR